MRTTGGCIMQLLATAFCIVAVASGQAYGDTPPKPGKIIVTTPPIEPFKGRVDGFFLVAFEHARLHWLGDKKIRPDDKKLENYRVSFQLKKREIVVTFVPKLDGEPGRMGGVSRFGREVAYRLRRKDYSLIERYFGE
jgi:hypothetical protein